MLKNVTDLQYFYVFVSPLAELFLEMNDLQKIMMFEERCVDSYLREKDTLLHASQEEKIRVMGDRSVIKY